MRWVSEETASVEGAAPHQSEEREALPSCLPLAPGWQPQPPKEHDLGFQQGLKRELLSVADAAAWPEGRPGPLQGPRLLWHKVETTLTGGSCSSNHT